jgi:hypothetical protein
MFAFGRSCMTFLCASKNHKQIIPILFTLNQFAKIHEHTEKFPEKFSLNNTEFSGNIHFDSAHLSRIFSELSQPVTFCRKPAHPKVFLLQNFFL